MDRNSLLTIPKERQTYITARSSIPLVVVRILTDMVQFRTPGAYTVQLDCYCLVFPRKSLPKKEKRSARLKAVMSEAD